MGSRSRCQRPGGAVHSRQYDDRRPAVTYMWTDPGVVRAVVDNHRPVIRRRVVDKAARRVRNPEPAVRLGRITAARPTEARGA